MCLENDFVALTYGIFYCSIINNWIVHMFQNLETSSEIHTSLILYTYFIFSEDMTKQRRKTLSVTWIIQDKLYLIEHILLS